MKKHFVLDTNVLIHDPQSIFSFQDNNVYIPITVIEELDNFKSEKTDRGYNAREVSRIFDSLCGRGRLLEGLSLGENMGTLQVISDSFDSSLNLLQKSNDNYILGAALNLINKLKEAVILVTKDTMLRIKADSFGITTQDYLNDKVDNIEDMAKIKDITMSTETIDYICDSAKAGQSLTLDKNSPEELWSDYFHEGGSFVLKSDTSKSILVRALKNVVKRIDTSTAAMKTLGIKPLNLEQHFMMDALKDPKIDLVICGGIAGSGKTLLSLAEGINAVSMGKYQSLMIIKTIQAVGNDIGYLPGTKEEKLREWIAPFSDNLELIAMSSPKKKGTTDIFEDNRIEVDTLAYMRGRSLMNKFIIVDECQNLTKGEVKTIITRIHDTSKLVLLGDFHQIDNPYLTLKTNGLVHAMQKLQGLENIAILNMRIGERGRLAKAAIEKL